MRANVNKECVLCAYVSIELCACVSIELYTYVSIELCVCVSIELCAYVSKVSTEHGVRHSQLLAPLVKARILTRM
jgi:hypothetical protein